MSKNVSSSSLIVQSGLMHCLGPGDSDLQVELLIATIYEEKITVDSPPRWFPRNDLFIGVFGTELTCH